MTGYCARNDGRVRRRGGTSMIVVRLAYPARPRAATRECPYVVGSGVPRDVWRWIPTFVGMTMLCNAPVGARPCGCPGAGWGTPSAPHRQTSRIPPRFLAPLGMTEVALGMTGCCVRNDGVLRAERWPGSASRWGVNDRGASGVPGPAPGQPQGRAPTKGHRLLAGPPLSFGHFPMNGGNRYAALVA